MAFWDDRPDFGLDFTPDLRRRRELLKARLNRAAEFLGILQQDPEQWLHGGTSDDVVSAAEVESLIAERQQAKLDKNYARADEIRESLLVQSVVLEDSREGTKWRRGSE